MMLKPRNLENFRNFGHNLALLSFQFHTITKVWPIFDSTSKFAFKLEHFLAVFTV